MILGMRNWSKIVKLYISNKKQPLRTLAQVKEMIQSCTVFVMLLYQHGGISCESCMSIVYVALKTVFLKKMLFWNLEIILMSDSKKIRRKKKSKSI